MEVEVENVLARDLRDNQYMCACPSKYSFCSLLTFFPIQYVLNLYNLAENTYYDDKKLFEEQYPDRIAVDIVKTLLNSVTEDEINVVDKV